MHASNRSSEITAPRIDLAPAGSRPVVELDRIGLLDPWAQWVKRTLDLFFVMVLGLIAVVPGVLIAIAIVLDSRGPVFFAHTRVGKGRGSLRIWKFRSMVRDADSRLQEYLRRNPASAAEWARTHKLRDDPRVTRVGRFLRKTSLDELPQLWNVLRGDMSMVGPRPIVSEEIAKYGAGFRLYAKVLPGLTGLWQVSGRNDMHYSRRVELDCHYIRRWSLLMDCRILFRTVRVVLLGHGAY
jgi:Undecaprenyl-phosphate galactose phosphotransferase WbaP